MIQICCCALWIGHTSDRQWGMLADLIESDGEG